MSGRIQSDSAIRASGHTALFVGAFVPGSQGSRGISEDVGIRLGHAGWNVLTTSRSAGRLGRLADMTYTCWHERNRYRVAAVDVYSGMAFGWAEAACWVLRKAQKPYVLMLHGGNLPIFAEGQPQRMRKLLSSAAAVTAPSRYLLENMQPYREDILLIPNALDISAYPFRMRHAASPRLIWLRAFHDTYNPELAVRVLARLADSFPDIELTMVGPDKGDGSLERTRKEAERLGVSTRIKIIGGVPKNEVAAQLATADVFLNTTRADNTPVSVLEAMACGLCIVSTNVGGIPYLLEDGRNALLVAPDNVDAMTAAVSKTLTDQELAKRLSLQSRQDAERFDWPSVTLQWNTLLQAVAQSNARDRISGIVLDASSRVSEPGAVHAEARSSRSGSAA